MYVQSVCMRERKCVDVGGEMWHIRGYRGVNRKKEGGKGNKKDEIMLLSLCQLNGNYSQLVRGYLN